MTILWLIPAMLLVLVTLAVILRLLELAFPPFSRWLDEHFGEDGGIW